MFADERRLKIIERLKEKPSVTVAELTSAFQVSLETIRRDLEFLEKEGALKRVHGGAVSIKKMPSYSRPSSRISSHYMEKKQLAMAALPLIKEGDVIALDSGTTALTLAQLVCDSFQELTVITNSLEVFQTLSVKESFHVILTGGYYHPVEKAFFGHLTLDTIKQLHASVFFLTPWAISLKFGISDFTQEMIPVQRSLISIADQVAVLADSSKFETEAALKICELNPAYTYITDEFLSPEIRTLYEEHSILIQCQREKN